MNKLLKLLATALLAAGTTTAADYQLIGNYLWESWPGLWSGQVTVKSQNPLVVSMNGNRGAGIVVDGITEMTVGRIEIKYSSNLGAVLNISNGEVEISAHLEAGTDKIVTLARNDFGLQGIHLEGMVKEEFGIYFSPTISSPTTDLTVTSLILKEPFVPVSDVINIPSVAEINKMITLLPTVEPSNATSKDIVWSIESGNATIDGNKLTPLSKGKIRIKATIADGLASGDFTKIFDIDAVAAIVYYEFAKNYGDNWHMANDWQGASASTSVNDLKKPCERLLPDDKIEVSLLARGIGGNGNHLFFHGSEYYKHHTTKQFENLSLVSIDIEYSSSRNLLFSIKGHNFPNVPAIVFFAFRRTKPNTYADLLGLGFRPYTH